MFNEIFGFSNNPTWSMSYRPDTYGQYYQGALGQMQSRAQDQLLASCLCGSAAGLQDALRPLTLKELERVDTSYLTEPELKEFKSKVSFRKAMELKGADFSETL